MGQEDSPLCVIKVQTLVKHRRRAKLMQVVLFRPETDATVQEARPIPQFVVFLFSNAGLGGSKLLCLLLLGSVRA